MPVRLSDIPDQPSGLVRLSEVPDQIQPEPVKSNGGGLTWAQRHNIFKLGVEKGILPKILAPDFKSTEPGPPTPYDEQVRFFYNAMKTDPEVTKEGFALTGFGDPMGVSSYISKKWGKGDIAAFQDARRQYVSDLPWTDSEKWKNLAVDFEKTILELKGMPAKTGAGVFGLHSLLQAPTAAQTEKDWQTYLKEKGYEGAKSFALGKLYDVLGGIKNPVLRRGGGAVAGGGAAAVQGADLGNTLLGAGQGAVFTPYTGGRPTPVEVTKRSSEIPAPLGNEKPPVPGAVSVPPQGPGPSEAPSIAGSLPSEERTMVPVPENLRATPPPEIPIQETGGKQETVVPPPVNKWATIDEALTAENLLKPLTPGSPESLRAAEIRNQYLPPQKPPTVPPVAAPGAPEPEPGPKPRRLTLTQAKKQGHAIPDILGWTNAQRMDFNKSITGKTSMKDMNVKEARLVVEGMQAEAKWLGFDLSKVEKPTSVADELILSLQKNKPKITETTDPHPPLWRKTVYETKKFVLEKVWGIERMPFRFFDALDGRDINGPWKRLVFKPLMDKSSQARIYALREHKEMAKTLDSITGGRWEKLWSPQRIPGVKYKYTPIEKIYIVGQNRNEHGREVLRSNGVSEIDVANIEKSLTPPEIKLLEFAIQHGEKNTTPLFSTALQSGWDISKLKREFPYFPVEYTQTKGGTDFLDQLSDFSTGEQMAPGSRMLLPRIKGATGKVNMDIVSLLMNNDVKVHRFIQMAPLAKQLRSLTSNKKLMDELNSRTYGQGQKVLTEWLKVKIRGGPKDKIENEAEALFAWARRKGTAFASARNVLMAVKQPLSLFSGLDDSPALIPYAAKEVGHLFTNLHRVRELNNFVENRSNFMADRAIGKEVYKLHKTQQAKEIIKQRLDDKSVNWYSSLDRTTANLVWKIKYDYALDKLYAGDEVKAMQYADYEVLKTQSLPFKEDLSPLYRGGELSKQIAAFTRETATLGNHWIYDVYGAKIRGEIGYGKFAYRVMMGQMLPALILGAIARGRLPDDLGETGWDFLNFAAGPTIIGAKLVNKLLTGLDGGFVSASTWDGLLGVFQQAKKLPDWGSQTDEEKQKTIRLLIKKMGVVIGGTKILHGFPSAQDIRTLEGAYDLWMQNTQDPRRLIWSEYALKRGEEKTPQEGR